MPRGERAGLTTLPSRLEHAWRPDTGPLTMATDLLPPAATPTPWLWPTPSPFPEKLVHTFR